MLADGIPPSTIDDMTRRDVELYFIGRNKKYEDMIDIIKVGANKGFFGEK